MAAWGSPQSVYTSQTPDQVQSLPTATYGNDFVFAVDGRITGMRYYKHASNGAATHGLSLWTATGPTQVVGMSTSGESGAGWKTAAAPAPITVNAGTILRAVLHISGTQNVGRTNNFGTDLTVGDLTMLKQGYSGTSNAYPASTVTLTYFVDVIFEAMPAAPTPPTTGQIWPRGNP